MKRQTLRKTIVLLSVLLVPITLSYISPAAFAKGTSQGILTISFIFITSIFILSLIFGRIWCGYLCPIGGLQDLYCRSCDKKAKGGKFNWIKFIIWAPWLTFVVIQLLKAGGFSLFDPLFLTEEGISIRHPQVISTYFMLISSTFIITFAFGKRAFCHYLCPTAPFIIIGTKIKQLLKWPSLRLKSDKENCIECKRCSTVCPMSLDVHIHVKDESMDNMECIMCGECVDNCTQNAIFYSYK